MQIFEMEPTVRATLRLAPLIGDVHSFSPTHPLRHAMKAIYSPDKATWEDLRSVMTLELAASAITEHLQGQVDDRNLRRHLRTERHCRSLLFEALCLKLVIEPRVEHVSWRRFEPRLSDIITTGPDIQFECTLAQDAQLETLLERATTRRKRRQNYDEDLPFVVIAGTGIVRDQHLIGDLTGTVREALNERMGRYREVSAIVLVAPRHLAEDEWLQEVNPETQVLRFDQHYLVWMRNKTAARPLPDGFEGY